MENKFANLKYVRDIKHPEWPEEFFGVAVYHDEDFNLKFFSRHFGNEMPKFYDTLFYNEHQSVQEQVNNIKKTIGRSLQLESILNGE